MAEIDHGVGESLEGIVQSADAFETKQQPAELVFPGKDAFNGPEALPSLQSLCDALPALTAIARAIGADLQGDLCARTRQFDAIGAYRVRAISPITILDNEIPYVYSHRTEERRV